jgi:hypothetical protein
MPRAPGKGRVTKPKPKPVDGELRERKHGDHSHTERWSAERKAWEPVD